MKLTGKVHKFGDNVNTDEIIPARYLNTSDPEELAKHCMEDADPGFVKKAATGDIIVGGENFGCGSSREHAPIAIKAFGISCVIAKSFARIFYRNAINMGLPIFTSEEASEELTSGDIIEIEPEKGTIVKKGKNDPYSAEVFPSFITEIVSNGGLMGYASKKIGKKRTASSKDSAEKKTKTKISSGKKTAAQKKKVVKKKPVKKKKSVQKKKPAQKKIVKKTTGKKQTTGKTKKKSARKKSSKK